MAEAHGAEMMSKEKQICFRVDQGFFEEFIDQPRKDNGFACLSPFMREVLVAHKTGRKRKMSVAAEASLHQLCAELELLRVAMGDAVLRTYDLENKADGRDFQKLSENSEKILKKIASKLLN